MASQSNLPPHLTYTTHIYLKNKNPLEKNCWRMAPFIIRRKIWRDGTPQASQFWYFFQALLLL